MGSSCDLSLVVQVDFKQMRFDTLISTSPLTSAGTPRVILLVGTHQQRSFYYYRGSSPNLYACWTTVADSRDKMSRCTFLASIEGSLDQEMSDHFPWSMKLQIQVLCITNVRCEVNPIIMIATEFVLNSPVLIFPSQDLPGPIAKIHLILTCT